MIIGGDAKGFLRGIGLVEIVMDVILRSLFLVLLHNSMKLILYFSSNLRLALGLIVIDG